MAALLAAIALGALEWHWRTAGASASVNPSSDRALWAFHRRKLDHDNQAIAIIGTSRALFDIDPDELSRAASAQNVRQLAIVATHPLAVLEDLAADQDFKGRIICELTEESLSTTAWESQRPYTNVRGEHFTVPERYGAFMRAHVEEQVVLLNPALATLNRVKWSALGMTDVRTRWNANRSSDCVAGHEMPLEWSAAAVDSALAAARADLSISFEHQLSRLGRVVDRLQRRAIPIAFVRAPVAPAIQEFYNRHLPRAEYWDRMVEAIDAPFIRADDFSELSGFHPPDGSHLCGSDAIVFTGRLSNLLISRNLLGPSGRAPEPANDVERTPEWRDAE